jgi:hypothetical protein
VIARFWLLLPAWCFCTADMTLTLLGQPAAYWSGDYGQAAEVNPIAYPLLAYHPVLFIGGGIVWQAAVGAVVLLWRQRFARWLAIGLAIGHAVGGSSWLAYPAPVGWVLPVGYLVAASWFAGVCWRRADSPRGI